MKRRIILPVAVALFLLSACGNPPEKNDPKQGKSNEELRLKGDKTVYGLACEGSSDSTIVLLPSDGSDPVKYDCIDATRNHRVLGTIKVGDWIGVVLNKKDKKVADQVIDLDELKGIWCYIVMPTLKAYDQLSKKAQARIERNMPDSIKETYLIPREYGFKMQRHWQAGSVGYVNENTSLGNESPVSYPQLGYFTEWRIWNGKVVLYSLKDPKKGVHPWNIQKDTCDIDYLKNDSLVLSSDGVSRGYYRKASEQELNKKAREIANKLQREAINSTINK